MESEELRKLNDKIYRGLDLSFRKLLNKLADRDDELVVSRKGKIVRVKARNFEKQ